MAWAGPSSPVSREEPFASSTHYQAIAGAHRVIAPAGVVRPQADLPLTMPEADWHSRREADKHRPLRRSSIWHTIRAKSHRRPMLLGRRGVPASRAAPTDPEPASRSTRFRSNIGHRTNDHFLRQRHPSPVVHSCSDMRAMNLGPQRLSGDKPETSDRPRRAGSSSRYGIGRSHRSTPRSRNADPAEARYVPVPHTADHRSSNYGVRVPLWPSRARQGSCPRACGLHGSPCYPSMRAYS